MRSSQVPGSCKPGAGSWELGAVKGPAGQIWTIPSKPVSFKVRLNYQSVSQSATVDRELLDDDGTGIGGTRRLEEKVKGRRSCHHLA